MKGKLRNSTESGARDQRVRVEVFEGEDETWRERAQVLRSWSGRFFGGALAEVYEHVEVHRNESATINDLSLTVLRFDTGLVRIIASELYHVLIMLTGRRAQRLVFMASEPEELEAYRLLLRRYEPNSTVTEGDIMASLPDFERRVTSWEHDATETMSDLIMVGVVVQVLEKGGFRDHLLINTAGTTELTNFI